MMSKSKVSCRFSMFSSSVCEGSRERRAVEPSVGQRGLGNLLWRKWNIRENTREHLGSSNFNVLSESDDETVHHKKR